MAHFAYASALSPVRGGMLISLGILNLIIAAIMNLFGGRIWIVLGILQVVWAIAEFRKFGQYVE